VAVFVDVCSESLENDCNIPLVNFDFVLGELIMETKEFP
jgi:hypothetical protein